MMPPIMSSPSRNGKIRSQTRETDDVAICSVCTFAVRFEETGNRPASINRSSGVTSDSAGYHLSIAGTLPVRHCLMGSLDKIGILCHLGIFFDSASSIAADQHTDPDGLTACKYLKALLFGLLWIFSKSERFSNLFGFLMI